MSETTSTESAETPVPQRLLLRAELEARHWSAVGHTIQISESWIFVHTHESAYIGDRVEIQLSFPGLLEPLGLVGHVVSQMLPAEPGEPRGLTLALAFRNGREEKRLREILERIKNPPTERRRSDRDYRVLVIEDSRIVQEMFRHGVLRYFANRQDAASIDVAGTLEEAWESLDDNSYDLLIVDYFLPDGTGESLIRGLRGRPEIASTPVIAVSVGGDPARAASLSAGADLFLHKPLVLRDLFQTIEHLTPHWEHA